MGDATEAQLVHAAVEELCDIYARLHDPGRATEPLLGAVIFMYFDGSDASQFIGEVSFVPRRKLEHCIAEGMLELLWTMWDPEGFDAAFADRSSLPGGPGTPEPDVFSEPMPALEAVCAHVMEEDAWGLHERVMVATCKRLSERWGIVVVGAGDSAGWSLATLREVVVHGLGPEEAARWEQHDWLPRNRDGEVALREKETDVVCHIALPGGQVAAVFRSWGGLTITRHLSPGGGGTGLSSHVEILGGGDPLVLGGLLPEGAVRVEVQDLADRWHQATTGVGAWIAALPHPDLGGPPPVVFRGADGAIVEADAPASCFAFYGGALDDEDDDWDDEAEWEGDEAWGPEPAPGELEHMLADWRRTAAEHQRHLLEKALVPALWAAELGGAPGLVGSGSSSAGTDMLALGTERGRVETTLLRPGGAHDEEARAALAALLVEGGLDERSAGRAVWRATPTAAVVACDLRPATVLVALEAGGHAIVVAASRGQRLLVTITGRAPLPRSMTLGRVDPAAPELPELPA